MYIYIYIVCVCVSLSYCYYYHYLELGSHRTQVHFKCQRALWLAMQMPVCFGGGGAVQQLRLRRVWNILFDDRHVDHCVDNDVRHVHLYP